MRIIIPVFGFAPTGGYRVLAKLADEWLMMGHDVCFISTEWSIEPYFSTNAKVIWVDTAGDLVSKEKGKPIQGLSALYLVMKSLYLGIRKHAGDADFIIANQNLTVWPVLFFRTSAKKIYYIQAYEPEYYHTKQIKSFVLKAMSYLSYYALTEKIVNSPIYLNYKNLRAYRVVAPGLDFKIFFPVSRSRSNNHWVIGCIGRKEKEKGTEYVVKAFEELTAAGLPIKLHVAYGNIPKFISQRYDCKVSIPQNDQQLGDFYRSLDIMIAPGTLQLGAPHYPVMEAMACGIPIITTGYLPADESNAWIVPIGNVQAIVDAVKSIIEMDQNYLDEKINKGLVDISPYGWNEVSKKFECYMKEISSVS